MTNKDIVIQTTVSFVQQTLAEAEGSHDWWHIARVWKNAKTIAETEGGDLFVIELGALLHDIADAKFHGGDEEIAPQKTKVFLNSLNVAEEIVAHVVNIVKHISFKGGKDAQPFKSLELDIVQDADRLEAIGAVGVARACAYGGYKKREIYNPNILPNLHMTREEYKHSKGTTINHFYEKLLLLKDRFNTHTGRTLAEDRHKFMEVFLEQFYKEVS